MTVGGRSCHERFTYKSAVSSGPSLARIFREPGFIGIGGSFEILDHLVGDDQRVFYLPRLGHVTENAKLNGKFVAVLSDVGVHPARISFQEGAVARIRRLQRLRGCGPQAENPLLAVELRAAARRGSPRVLRRRSGASRPSARDGPAPSHIPARRKDRSGSRRRWWAHREHRA